MRTVVVLLCLLFVAVPAPVFSQAATDSTGTGGPLFVHSDLYFAAGFVAGTILMLPLDRALAKEVQDSVLQANKIFHFSANAVGDLGRTGAFVIGPTMYAAGRIFKVDRMADLGLHGTEALLVAEASNRVIKALAGRARPYVKDAQRPGNFKLLRGLHDQDYQSFVSGHSAIAFAAAATVVGETEQWWPDWKPVIATAMYGGASLVALSRMYNNKHWASDVVGGAAIGTFAGWKVVRWNHTKHPNNRINRWLLGATVSTGSNGPNLVRVWIAPSR